MVSSLTEGVKVSVMTQFLAAHSQASAGHYAFAYRIRIENQSGHSVQLLRRHWFIFDSDGSQREVEGEGVVGQQPVLEPGQVHEYVSGCHLQTTIGKMQGTYLMERLFDGRQFLVQIPEFTLIPPFQLN